MQTLGLPSWETQVGRPRSVFDVPKAESWKVMFGASVKATLELPQSALAARYLDAGRRRTAFDGGIAGERKRLDPDLRPDVW
ncbi:MAG: hypothetical protein QM757_23425 [Paludibaculum sp.]